MKNKPVATNENINKEIIKWSSELLSTHGYIYDALCNYRLMIACDKARLSASLFQRHGRVSIPLKEFITACIAL